MTKPQFPDLIYFLTKLYEGINRQDRAEYAALLVPRIREDLQNFRPRISASVDKISYDAILPRVMQQLDELEKYYQNFDRKKPRISKKAAQGLQASLREQIDALEQLSKK
jgi:hypothetical protein